MLRYVGLLGASLMLWPIPAAAQTETLCTGVGLDAREEASAFSHTLKLVFAARGGNYVGDVKVRIEKAGAEVFTGTCDGPWLLLQLDPGTYKVAAEFEGQRSAFDVRVGRGKTQKTVVFKNAE